MLKPGIGSSDMEEAMTVRDILEGAASPLLLLAMIILCLLFAVYDRLAVLIVGHRAGVEPSPIPALGRR
jgi:hypothetical protein